MAVVADDQGGQPPSRAIGAPAARGRLALAWGAEGPGRTIAGVVGMLESATFDWFDRDTDIDRLCDLIFVPVDRPVSLDRHGIALPDHCARVRPQLTPQNVGAMLWL
jgi:hypothetical protein